MVRLAGSLSWYAPVVRIEEDRLMISGPRQRALTSSLRRGVPETVVAARSGVGAIDDDGRGAGPSDWTLSA
jgi:hypothetical protein